MFNRSNNNNFVLAPFTQALPSKWDKEYVTNEADQAKM